VLTDRTGNVTSICRLYSGELIHVWIVIFKCVFSGILQSQIIALMFPSSQLLVKVHVSSLLLPGLHM
jgi:hypothetical protein